MIRRIRRYVKPYVKPLWPFELYRRLLRWTRWPPVGRVGFGDLRQLSAFGHDLGPAQRPVVRGYEEGFLRRHAADLQGRVLRIGDELLGDEPTACTDADVTQRADWEAVDRLPADAFDAVVCVRGLAFAVDPRAAAAALHRILAPGGTLLATVPGLGPPPGGLWGFTELSLQGLLDTAFVGGVVEVHAFGNVLSAVLDLYGLGAENLSEAELAHHDPRYPLVVAGRAVKSGGGA